MTDYDADFILDELEAFDLFICSRCLKEKPRAGSVTMPGEDTHTSYRWCETCLADAYRQRYGDGPRPCGKRRDADGRRDVSRLKRGNTSTARRPLRQ